MPASTLVPPRVRGRAAIDSLHEAAGNAAVSRLLKERPRPSNLVMLQRSIGCHPLAGGAPQFQIDDKRPDWIGAAEQMMLGQNQDRAHIIAFEVIQNDLANILNSLLAALGTAAWGAREQQLIHLCDALFVTPNAEQKAMAARRTNLVTYMKGLPAGPLAKAQMDQLTVLSGALLTVLNSCADNLRVGHSGANQSIGYSIDATFLPGTVLYAGQVQSVQAPPAAHAPPPPGAIIIPPLVGGAPQAITVGLTECLRLAPEDERKVHAYQTHSTLALSFVTSGTGGGALFHSTVGLGGAALGVAGPTPTVPGQHLSSTRMPSHARNPPLPVLVMGSGNSVPFLFR